MEVSLSDSRHCQFITGDKTLSTHRLGGGMGPRAGLQNVMRKTSLPAGNATLVQEPTLTQLSRFLRLFP
jgi:hypothetical protein